MIKNAIQPVIMGSMAFFFLKKHKNICFLYKIEDYYITLCAKTYKTTIL